MLDREDFGILTTTMDGIITAMNVMSDHMNNHTTMVVNELKDQGEKNLKFIEKVDNKLLQMKKDMQKLLKENEDTNGRTKQTSMIMRDQRESTIMLDKKLREIMKENLADAQRDNVLMLDKKLREMTERTDKQELAEATFKHNILAVIKEQNQQLIKCYGRNTSKITR